MSSPETITRAEADEHVQALVLEMRDVIRVEEAWAIALRHLREAEERGWREALGQSPA